MFLSHVKNRPGSSIQKSRNNTPILKIMQMMKKKLFVEITVDRCLSATNMKKGSKIFKNNSVT
jgi:hypothetical protein